MIKTRFRRLPLILLLSTMVLAPSTDATAQQHGELVWLELLTSDATGANTFYEQLFGWSIESDREGSYLITKDGDLLGGVTQVNPGDDADTDFKVSTWIVGFSVSDLKTSVSTAQELGAEVVYEISDSEGLATWAALEDPLGAQFLVLDSERELGIKEESGRFVWAELWTHDVAASSDFYTKVIGWERRDEDYLDDVYPLFTSLDESRAGLVQIDQDETSTGWAPYIGVDDLSATLQQAEQLGGEILLEPGEDIHEGRVAILADPSGVAFLVIELEEEE